MVPSMSINHNQNKNIKYDHSPAEFLDEPVAGVGDGGNGPHCKKVLHDLFCAKKNRHNESRQRNDMVQEEQRT